VRIRWIAGLTGDDKQECDLSGLDAFVPKRRAVEPTCQKGGVEPRLS
jgi:hypothetical protein